MSAPRLLNKPQNAAEACLSNWGNSNRSLAALLDDISSMSAFGGKADIEKERGGHKKPGTWPGFHFPGSGGSLCTLATGPAPLAVFEVPLVAA